MHLVRFLGVTFGLIVAYLVSMMSKVEYQVILSLIAFILVVDHLVIRILTQMYMQAVMEDLDKPKDMEDK